MKQKLMLTLISLPVLLFSTNVSAFGCIAITTDIQIAVRDKNSPAPKQRSTADHIQGKNCYGQTAVVTNKQVSVAPKVKEQTSHTTIVQDTPVEQNPLSQHGISGDTGNFSAHIHLPVDVPVSHYREAKMVVDFVEAIK